MKKFLVGLSAVVLMTCSCISIKASSSTFSVYEAQFTSLKANAENYENNAYAYFYGTNWADDSPALGKYSTESLSKFGISKDKKAVDGKISYYYDISNSQLLQLIRLSDTNHDLGLVCVSWSESGVFKVETWKNK